jgi:hypothetical protein
MTPGQFEAAIHGLGLSKPEGAALLRISVRNLHQKVAGERPIKPKEELILKLFIAHPRVLKPRDWMP